MDYAVGCRFARRVLLHRHLPVPFRRCAVFAGNTGSQRWLDHLCWNVAASKPGAPNADAPGWPEHGRALRGGGRALPRVRVSPTSVTKAVPACIKESAKRRSLNHHQPSLPLPRRDHGIAARCGVRETSINSPFGQRMHDNRHCRRNSQPTRVGVESVSEPGGQAFHCSGGFWTNQSATAQPIPGGVCRQTSDGVRGRPRGTARVWWVGCRAPRPPEFFFLCATWRIAGLALASN